MRTVAARAGGCGDTPLLQYGDGHCHEARDYRCCKKREELRDSQHPRGYMAAVQQFASDYR